jgi:hypothetical protein
VDEERYPQGGEVGVFTLQVILHDSVMGIRYYAYAVEADRIEDALECPSMFLSCDPLADALGMEVGAMSGTAIMRQVVPEQDMLYLDKAWSELQELSRTGGYDGGPRPSYRMFEGKVCMFGMGWEPWVRVLRPEEMKAISLDLKSLCLEEEFPILEHGDGISGGERISYVASYLRAACRFADVLVGSGRGMVYMIG